MIMTLFLASGNDCVDKNRIVKCSINLAKPYIIWRGVRVYL